MNEFISAQYVSPAVPYLSIFGEYNVYSYNTKCKPPGMLRRHRLYSNPCFSVRYVGGVQPRTGVGAGGRV